MIPQFDPSGQGRILGAALYEWAAFRQFRFRHSTREFLAAAWVHKRLEEGLPFEDAMELFGGEAFGKSVLINSRRTTLCWLTALNTLVREYVIEHFPELLMFEGDPSRWSKEDVTEAFQGYVAALEEGFLPNWWNDISEMRRVARCIPANLLNATLRKYPESPKVTGRILALIRYGAIDSCADTVFEFFSKVKSADYRQDYLLTLSTIATASQRAEIKALLITGKLATGRLVAAAFTVLDANALSVNEFVGVFKAVAGEDAFGGGPVHQAIKYHVLTRADGRAAVRVLQALMQSVPADPDGQPAIPEGLPGGNEAWKYHLIPTSLASVVEAMDPSSTVASPLVVDAFLLALRTADSGYHPNDDLKSVRAFLELNAPLRRAILFAGSQPAPPEYPLRRKLGLMELLVKPEEDLEWMIEKSGRPDLAEEGRWIWFELAAAIASPWDGPVGADAIGRLIGILPAEEAKRKAWFDEMERFREEHVQRGKQRAANQSKREIEQHIADVKTRQVFIDKLDSVREGTNVDLFNWLLQSFPLSKERATYSAIHLDEVRKRLGEDVAAAVSAGLEAVWRSISPPDVTVYTRSQVPWMGLLGLASFNHSLATGVEPASLAESEIHKMARLAVWDIDGPSPALKMLSETKPAAIYDALAKWAEHELKTHVDEQGLPRTVGLLLSCPPPVKERLLRVAVDLLRADEIPSLEIQARVLPEAFKLGLIDQATLGAMASHRLSKKHEEVSIRRKQEWLNTWINFDLPAAWRWIELKSQDLKTDEQKAQKAACLVEVMSGKWAECLTGTPEEIRVLQMIYRFLAPYVELNLENSSTGGWHRVVQLREAIARTLANFPRVEAHGALEALALDPDASEYQGAWLRSLVLEQAIKHVEEKKKLKPGELMKIGEGHRRDPLSERELFTQVMARLKEITKGVEFGPFSDRSLFSEETEEKQLQLWLAARLRDTPRRRFTPRFGVFREPQVDAEKRTDIEVSTQGFKVCIEIKPVKGSKYSANDLVKTLSDQLVARYLKGGENSKNGILVIFRLDTKTWQIPGKRRASFMELIAFLNQEADRIRDEAGVETLQVIGIDCVDRSLPTAASK